MVSRLPGTFGKASDETGTDLPIDRESSGGVTAAAQSGSNSKESSSPICGAGNQARAANTAAASAKRLNTFTSGWTNLTYAAAVTIPPSGLSSRHRICRNGQTRAKVDLAAIFIAVLIARQKGDRLMHGSICQLLRAA